jgi:hypothetical protein
MVEPLTRILQRHGTNPFSTVATSEMLGPEPTMHQLPVYTPSCLWAEVPEIWPKFTYGTSPVGDHGTSLTACATAATCLLQGSNTL